MDQATIDNTALLSIIAIGISSLALIWNIVWSIYREFARPKFKVTFYVGANYIVNQQQFFAEPSVIVDAATKTSDWEIQIIITNYGKDVLKMRELYAIRKGISRIFNSNEMRIDTKLELPIKIEYGDDLQIKLPFNKNCFLAYKSIKLGVIDNFGKSHWASRKDMKKARKLWEKEFRS